MRQLLLGWMVCASLWGQEPEAFRVEVQGSGPPVLLIPGLGCGGNVWDGTVARLSERYTCHVFTLAGFAGQPALPAPFLETIRDALLAYIEDQQLERPAVIGHSLGAFLALWLGCQAPEKVGPLLAVDGLPYYTALLVPGADSAAVETQAQALRARFAGLSQEQYAAVNPANLSWMIKDQADIEHVAAESNLSDPQAVGQAAYEMMHVDLREQVARIQSPVLLLGATALAQDEAQRTAIEQAYRAQMEPIPQHTVRFNAEARHFVQLDARDWFYEQVEAFLAEDGQ